MLTPQQIDTKRFTVVRLRSGYDQDEVDNFMDRVIRDYEFLYDNRNYIPFPPTPTSHGVTQAMPKVPDVDPPTPSEMIAKVLAVAEDTASKHVHDGKVEAEQLRLKAKDEAEILIGNTQVDATSILENARRQAEEIVSSANGERHRIIGELEERRHDLKEKVDELIRAETEVTTRLRNALERWND